MVEENRPHSSEVPGDSEYSYFGPFGPFGPGQGRVEDDDAQPITQVDPRYAPAQAPIQSFGGGPAYPATQPFAGESLFPAPPGVVPLRPRPPHEVAFAYAPSTARRPMRGATVIAVAALTALLIGSAAGFGGAKLADLSAGTTSDPAPLPSRSVPRNPLPPAPIRANTVEVAKAVLPSTVMIKAGSSAEAATGSGFVLDTRGHIMTNNHVVEGAAGGGRIEVVFNDGSRDRATIVGRSPSYDLAVIKVAASRSLVPMQIGDSEATQVGETVIAVGAPLALPGTVTEGIISSRNRPVVVNASGNADAASAYINAIQTDAPINPGNSGGPLIDAAARVIGVNSAILTLGQSRGASGNIGLGFAIPINQAMDIGDLLIKDGKATYPVIGANVSGSDDRTGVELTTVEPDGPADRAGLREGDTVTSIDGVPVSDIEQLIVTIRTHRPKDVVELGYRRGSSSGEARVTLGSKEG